MIRQSVYSNSNNKVFWSLFLLSLFFVNTSIITNSKIQISFFIFYFFIIFFKQLNTIYLKDDSKILLFFLGSLYISQLANFGFSFLDKTITQLINFTIYIFTYIIIDNFLNNSKVDTSYILNKLFKIFTLVAFLTIVLYLIGLLYPNIIYWATHLINNSGSFSIGGIISSFGWWGPPRLNTFTPEPSFIAFLLAINIAIGSSLAVRHRLYLFINTIALLLTLSRTGYLMYVLLLFLILYQSFSLRIRFIIKNILVILISLTVLMIDWNIIFNYDDSFAQRFGSVITAFDVIKSNPVFGIGFGSFTEYAANLELDYRDIFNFYLYLFVAGGFIPLAIFLFFLYYIFKISEKRYRPILLVIFIGWTTFSAYNILLVWFLFALIKKRKNNDLSYITKK